MWHLARLAALERNLDRTPGLFVSVTSYGVIAVNACLKESAPLADRVRAHLAARRSEGS